MERNPILKNKVSLDIYAIFFSNIYNRINSAQQFYPDFRDWYFSKVVPDILNSSREFIFENDSNNFIVGLSLIKFEEKKLCTLKVFDEFQNKGYGLKLFEKSFEKLNTNKPFLTVSEEKYSEFKKIFDYYGFELTNVKSSVYRQGKLEFFFNEK